MHSGSVYTEELQLQKSSDCIQTNQYSQSCFIHLSELLESANVHMCVDAESFAWVSNKMGK